MLEVCKVVGTKTSLEVTKLYLEQLLQTHHDSVTLINKLQHVFEENVGDGVELCKHVIDVAAAAISFQISDIVEQASVQV